MVSKNRGLKTLKSANRRVHSSTARAGYGWNRVILERSFD